MKHARQHTSALYNIDVKKDPNLGLFKTKKICCYSLITSAFNKNCKPS